MREVRAFTPADSRTAAGGGRDEGGAVVGSGAGRFAVGEVVGVPVAALDAGGGGVAAKGEAPELPAQAIATSASQIDSGILGAIAERPIAASLRRPRAPPSRTGRPRSTKSVTRAAGTSPALHGSARSCGS